MNQQQSIGFNNNVLTKMRHNCKIFTLQKFVNFLSFIRPNVLSITVQDDLLVTVIFGKFVCEKQLVGFVLTTQAIVSFFLSFFVLSCGYYGHVHIAINNYWQF